MATLLENEINATEGDKTGQTAHVQQIMFSLKDKKCRVFKDIFWDVDEYRSAQQGKCKNVLIVARNY